MEEIGEMTNEREMQTLEERTINLLQDSKIDQEFSAAKVRKSGGKKHKLKWLRRPMAIPEVILELHDQTIRENALRCLSNFLLEKREEDPDNYYRTGYLLFTSFGSMTILTQELLSFFRKMVDGTLNVRSSKRAANVLTLFQSIAANKDTRQKFVNTCVPNFLIPMILHESIEEAYADVQAISLSVIGILCQTREPEIIQWAIESDMVEVCRTAMEIGNEISKVISMHVIEAILQDRSGISHICNPLCDPLLTRLMETFKHLVCVLAVHQDFSPRLLFHIIRCYVLLCNHSRGLTVVIESLPDAIMDDTFHEITEEFPIIHNLLYQLLLTIGTVEEIPMRKQEVLPPLPLEEMPPLKKDHCVHDFLYNDASLLRQIDLNQENCFVTPQAQPPPLILTGKENTLCDRNAYILKQPMIILAG